MSELKRMYTIKTNSEQEMCQMRDTIHMQLVGDINYINGNIILNGSDDRQDGTENEIHVYIFEECDPIPNITIPGLWTL